MENPTGSIRRSNRFDTCILRQGGLTARMFRLGEHVVGQCDTPLREGTVNLNTAPQHHIPTYPLSYTCWDIEKLIKKKRFVAALVEGLMNYF